MSVQRVAQSQYGYDLALVELESRVQGAVLLPGDAEYEAGRAVWNTTYAARKPSIIVRAAGTVDVAAAISCARHFDLEIAVRSGGHGMTGMGTVDGGMVIDLSAMKAMEIDPERRVARVQPGLTWGEYAAQAQQYGLATTSGDMHSVGIGGLTAGGGIGWMVRKYGLTIDHLLSAEVVTANGEILTASETENRDLFWAIRGGGGNFGVITSLELQLQPVPQILGGAVIFDAAETEEILPKYVEYALSAPDGLTTIATVMQSPPLPFVPPDMHSKPVLIVMFAYTGDLEEGPRAVDPLRTLGTAIGEVAAPMPYLGMFEFTKEGSVHGMHHRIRTMYLDAMTPETARIIAEHGRTMTSPGAMSQIRVLGGAMSRVAPDATAFAHRTKPIMFSIITGWPDEADASAPVHEAWVERYWQAIRPYASGAYVNFLSDDGADRIRDAYPPATYRRLQAIKRRYDPGNVFHLNQNILPFEEEAYAADAA